MNDKLYIQNWLEFIIYYFVACWNIDGFLLCDFEINSNTWKRYYFDYWSANQNFSINIT